MPKAWERKLKALAKKRGYGKKRTKTFVYGTMIKHSSWRPRKRSKK